MSKLYIQAMAAKITQEELRENLPAETMAKLQGKTVTPYVIGEEGRSTPNVRGEGHRVLTWPRAVIRRMSQTIKAGTKLFVGHNSDSSTENRPDVGEVVGTFSRIVKDKLQAVAVTVLGSGTDDYDICSIEADAEFDKDGHVGDIGEISGIALGSSKTDSPAFPGAQRVAALQCFGEAAPKEENKPTLEKGDKNKMEITFIDVQKAIKDMKIYPHQLYSEAEMKDDSTVKTIVAQNESLTKDLETSNTKLKELGEKGAEVERKASLSDAKERFAKMIPEGATDKQKAFYEKKFNPESIEDLTNEGLKKTFEKYQTDFSEYAKMFGGEEKTEPSGGPSGGESEKGSDDPIDSAVDALMED